MIVSICRGAQFAPSNKHIFDDVRSADRNIVGECFGH